MNTGMICMPDKFMPVNFPNLFFQKGNKKYLIKSIRPSLFVCNFIYTTSIRVCITDVHLVDNGNIGCLYVHGGILIRTRPHIYADRAQLPLVALDCR
jgi:hypothetical protein